MEVTDEMRKAVYEADCAQYGHIADISQAISNDPHSNPSANTPTIRSDDPFKMPHIFCRRCQKVWLVIDIPGDNYDSALENLNNQLLAKYKRAAPPTESASLEEVHDHAHDVP